ncbi:MAG TPA: 3-carboxy-cis,cis-muconate cycloisomerase [Thermomicrobiales bacterium]|nr:3-carboxy-cis,cis-muconate cycloisomerase [Thermomicrobiales bacterium]
MSQGFLDALYGDPEVGAIFSDRGWAARMVAVEVALARVQERLGVIPPGTATRIAAAAADLALDMAPLRQSMAQSGIPSTGMIAQLRAAAGEDAAAYVHRGATTQDILDTALVLQIRDALSHIDPEIEEIVGNLAALADRHRRTLMAGRTKSQQALPTTFGLKAAGWLAPLIRLRDRLREMKPRLLAVQFGGAVGTLASLGERGIDVMEGLAIELGLAAPAAPWHAARDNVAELAGWLSMLTGSLAKMAQDVILLGQSEVAEVRESDDPSRGASSTMPQKSNPVVSEAIIAAARTNASLLAAMHQALIQEHERGSGSWQIEWLTLPRMFELTASALNNARFLAANIVVDADRMRANLDSSNGLLLAEALNLALAPHLGSTETKRIIQAAVRTALAERRNLVEVVRERVDADLDWDALRDEASYLGSADAFIDRILAEAQPRD